MSDTKEQSVWLKYTSEERAAVDDLARDYIDFLSTCKTERESVVEAVRLAEACGYRDLGGLVARGEKLKAGDKVYAVNMKKAIVLFHIGTAPLEEGMNILGAHIDTCRLDVKQNPLYEDGGLAYFDTHYYGGIKKYQWVTIPLALHGVVVKKDGTVVEIVLGEKDGDPVFCVTDLLIHLSQEQLEKTAAKVIEGEKLDILIGSVPLKKDDKESVKDGILALLEEHYGIAAEDFQSAELTLVPAGRARELGFDRSLVLGYGQDDRVCSYTALRSMLETDAPRRTACTLLVDKEEIGSVGATGMQSRFFENMVAEVLSACGQYSDIALRRTLMHSKMLSSDVSSAYDGLYADAFEKKNVAYLGRGMVFNKFTGARGKSGSSDASAEYLGELRRIMDGAGVSYQLAELGRVDLGGGGTIAYIMANYGMNVIDNGVAVMSMHAPWEVTSKADIYEMKKGYDVFLKA
ncbi:aminopeptidase I zinc metalloprotease [Selenomonas sp. FOBRC9]|uniref:aminopeptidase n=1 Tax=Selenomonas sp. FOBRC9 TaxID=936573 RepID=UPI00027A44C2|nr:aminopeptidase [Selenomonas sp. FOBRC9]EJP32211.1 aminopeptidase I zinc metalloprotease [Selenomonas sp. FOBRC9]